MQLSWSNASGPRGGGGGFKILSYICGYCDNWVAAGVGYHATKVAVPSGADYGEQIRICPHCNELAYLSADGRQVPGSAFGATVAHLPSEDVRIRHKGKDGNHEIDLMGREDAEQLIKFSEMLMRIMYEYPAEVAAPTHTAVEQAAGTGS